MSSNDYVFQTRWRFAGTQDEIAEILADGPGLMRWWPSVYLDVKEIEPGEVSGVGKVIELYTKGWLPYTLRWSFKVTEAIRPCRIALEAWGDFNGSGVWTIEPDGDFVNVIYDWTVRADKPILRYLSLLMKPVFSDNHVLAMKMGEQSMQLELLRRRAASETERAAIPAPPAPTFAWLIRKP
jgi:hypothetical protein